MTAGIKANSDGSAAIQVGGTDVIGLGSTGNINFPVSGQRITGDFSNATIASRVMFQTSTANTSTSVSAIPNGTNTQSDFFAFNAADPNNASLLLMRATTSETTIRSGITGTGTYLPMTFYTAGTESMRLSATSKALILSGGDTTANGTGITFPATQSASSNANTLDDYEEGTWTPSSLISVTGASGRYTKIGRVVQWSCTFTYSASASGNAAYISGLPFTCENANASRAGSSIGFTDYGSSNITVLFAGNDIAAYFYNFSGTALTYANLSGKTIFCGGTYLTNT